MKLRSRSGARKVLALANTRWKTSCATSSASDSEPSVRVANMMTAGAKRCQVSAIAHGLPAIRARASSRSLVSPGSGATTSETGICVRRVDMRSMIKARQQSQ